MTNREKVAAAGYEDAVVFESPDYDDAIIGVTYDGCVVYDYDLMVKHLVEKQGMDWDEAVDFIGYNSSYMCGVDQYPVIMYRLEY